MSGEATGTPEPGADEAVLVVDEGPVRTITLHRPDKLNALDEHVRLGLAAAVRSTAEQPDVRAVVLRGAGRSFSAGADLRDPRGALVGESAGRRRLAGAWGRLLDELEALPQPTVAVLHGHVIGGAALLALGCDLRIGDETTAWSIPEVRLGLPLTWAGIPRLARDVGLSRARELVMTGRVVSADEAEALGLLHRVVAADELDRAASALVDQLVAADPGALASTKAAFAALGRQLGGRDLFWADPEVLDRAVADRRGENHDER
jgi:enoyl-CoA hydratase/carnithine racemase